MKHARRLLQIPQGAESLSLEEGYRHQRLVHAIQELLWRCGYLHAHVPVLDYYDTYRDLIDEDAHESVYRLVDREGDLLMLRSDITLFLAKQMGVVLQDSDLPVRASYADTILRHQSAEDISKNEFFQVGAELIGKDGLDGDLEILSVLTDVLGLLQLKEAHLHIGSRALFGGMCTNLSATDTRKAAHAVLTRSVSAITAELTQAHGPARAEQLTELLLFIGSVEDARGLVERAGLDPACYTAAVEVIDSAAFVAEDRNDIAVSVDFSEIGTQPYYTGSVFRVYVPGADSAVAAGGRYDDLLGYFGFPCASVGFSLMLRKAEAAMNAESVAGIPAPELTAGEGFRERLDRAREIRSKGGTAIP